MESRKDAGGGIAVIQKAKKDDVTAVAASYRELFEYESAHENRTNWVPGLYPSEGTAQTAFQDGTLYVCRENGVFCGSVIMNHVQPPEYQTIDWRYSAEPQEVLVLHTLCIPPSRKGRGYGRKFIEYAVQYAAQTGCKAVRLDTWAGNRPAAALYERMGFRLAGSGTMLLHGAIREEQIYLEYEVKQA